MNNENNKKTEIDVPDFLFKNKNNYKTENSCNKSIQKRNPTSIKKTRKKRYSKKQLIAAIAAAIVISSTVSSISTTKVSNFVEQMEIDNTLEKACNDYLKIVNSAVNDAAIYEKLELGPDHYAKGKIVNYDKSEIAEKIKEETNSKEERDYVIFTLYKKYGKDTSSAALNGITNGTVTHLEKDNNTNYEDLNDYINDLGYKTLEEYEDKMTEKIVNKYKYDLENNNNYGGK